MEDDLDLARLLRRWEAVQRQSAELLRAYDELLVRLDPPSPVGRRYAEMPAPSRRHRRPRLRLLRHPALSPS